MSSEEPKKKTSTVTKVLITVGVVSVVSLLALIGAGAGIASSFAKSNANRQQPMFFVNDSSCAVCKRPLAGPTVMLRANGLEVHPSCV